MKKLFYIFFIIFILFPPTFRAFAQSGGSATPPLEPATGGSVPTPTPTPSPTTPKSITPAPTPKPILPVTAESLNGPIPRAPSSNSSNLFIFVVAVALGIFGFFVSKIRKNKKDNPCGEIKKQCDKKSVELNDVRNKFSLQEALVLKIKQEIEEAKGEMEKYLEQELKDEMLKTMGSNAVSEAVKLFEKAKKEYDDFTEKYEKAKNLLEILRKKKGRLAGELETLELNYRQCVLNTVGETVTLKDEVKLAFPNGENTQETTLLYLYKPQEKKILLG